MLFLLIFAHQFGPSDSFSLHFGIKDASISARGSLDVQKAVILIQNRIDLSTFCKKWSKNTVQIAIINQFL